MTNAALSSRIATGLAACALLATATAAQAQGTPERGVFVTQIGDTSRANVSQRNSGSFARVVQDGANNQVDLEQDGSAAHRAQIAQDGNDNTVIVGQDGDGDASLVLIQSGNLNRADILQRETGGFASSATISQSGQGNSVSLIQDGSNNQAELSQSGDNNVMTAEQLGDGNMLSWEQNGSGLADLQISQNGGQAIQIVQTGGAGQ